METRNVKKVTRNDLRAIAAGAEVLFELPSQRQVKSVRTMCSYLNSAEGFTFTCTAGTLENDHSIKVTRR